MQEVHLREKGRVSVSTNWFWKICYEVLPFVFDDKLGRSDNIVIVVSPLVSFMLDQVQSLRSILVRVAIMSSGRSRQIVPGDCSLLLCALEAMQLTPQNGGKPLLKQTSFARFASVLGKTIVHAHRNIQQITNSKG